MSIVARTSAALAVAAVAGTAALANPAPFERTPDRAPVSIAVDLTAASTALKPWPPLPTPVVGQRVSEGAPVTSTAVRAQDLASVADQIDVSYLDYRYADRTRFTAFANQLGYLGKQLYVGYNLIESIVASSVFNGTDILRGEGVLKNIGQIAGDVLLSGLFVAIDEISLASPDTYPIVITRPPGDRPAEWGDAYNPTREGPLFVPPRYSTTNQQATAAVETAAPVAAAADRPTPFADGIDNVFIDGTVAFRTAVTPALNLLGFVGKQLYIGVNFTESILASAVFNTTSALRGDGVLRSIAIFGSDIGRAALFVAIDEASIGREPTAIAIDRAPQSSPPRWSEPDPPWNGPLTVPDRSREEVATTAQVTPAVGAGDDATAATLEKGSAANASSDQEVEKDSGTAGSADADATPKQGLLAQWKATKAEKAAAKAAAEADDTAKADKDARDDAASGTGSSSDASGTTTGKDAGDGKAGGTAASSDRSRGGAADSGTSSGSGE